MKKLIYILLLGFCVSCHYETPEYYIKMEMNTWIPEVDMKNVCTYWHPQAPIIRYYRSDFKRFHRKDINYLGNQSQLYGSFIGPIKIEDRERIKNFLIQSDTCQDQRFLNSDVDTIYVK